MRWGRRAGWDGSARGAYEIGAREAEAALRERLARDIEALPKHWVVVERGLVVQKTPCVTECSVLALVRGGGAACPVCNGTTEHVLGCPEQDKEH